MSDHVAGILSQWARERPDLDTSAMGIIGRLHRVATALHQELRPVFAEEGLGDGDFDVLAALRRSGAPFELSPGELGATTMVTSGTVTKRVDRLASLGLVTRSTDERDRRVSRVALTDAGRELVDRLVEKHVANEERLLAGFTELERARLTRLLTRWATELGV
ncbi:MarR family transcriptional regulator [Nocardioides seonyuensis]|uniref:MarR family transcriptional regulator n=1 Tax=Nocardioides seonyuensis TaxID=2518371 RepID=A0A4V1BMA8_9ACTN|nr:MarR family transcriptional regulator [Nocardioides seonyuensis]QBX55722.1 MarR family transcriptional regulator [Nocardioides seonyuensis]